jgi:predicted RNA-binding protein with PUA domain
MTVTDLIERLRVNAPQAESADQVQVTVPADPRAAAEQAIAEALRRERMAPDDYAPMPDRPVPMESE